MTEIILPTKSVPSYASLSVFPLSAPDGAIAIALDTDNLYVFNLATTAWIILATAGAIPGTVTSVGLSAPGIFSVSGSPVTSTGTLAFSLVTETANTVFSGPTSGGGAVPTFRTLVAADVPNLSATYVTQSEVGAANGVASLDVSGKVPPSQLGAFLLYKGLWNPSTNTPPLADGTGTIADTYFVSTTFTGPIAGLSNPTMINFEAGDLVLYNGTQYELTTPAAGVSSVNTLVGAVSLGLSDLTDVSILTPLTGQILGWDGADWANQNPAPSYIVTEDIFTLSPTDITNQYIDLNNTASGAHPTVNSIALNVVGGPEQLKGVDYIVDLSGGAGGVTRISFINGLATSGAQALVSGDILLIYYAY